MRRFTGVAAVLLALTAAAHTAAATQVAWDKATTRPCGYTPARFQQALRVAYGTINMPPHGSVIMLHRLAHCREQRLGYAAVGIPIFGRAAALRIWTSTRLRWQARRHAWLAATAETTARAWASSSVRCVLWTESRSTPNTLNTQDQNYSGHMGAAQWSYEAWNSQLAQLNLQGYPTSPLAATAVQQLTVLEGALAAGDGSAWFPYDGC